jgi:hypothetical protein
MKKKLSAINKGNIIPTSSGILDLEVDIAQFSNLFITLGLLGINATKLQLTDINFTIYENKVSDFNGELAGYVDFDDVQRLMDLGMSFFPALILVSTPPDERDNIKINNIPAESNHVTMGTVARTMFLIIFYAVIISNLPSNDNYIPQIVKQTFGQSIRPYSDIKSVMNCELSKLDLRFVFDFPFAELPEKFKNRLRLGFGGMRMLSAFGAAELIKDTPDDIKELQKKVQTILENGPDLNMHPLMRDNTIITKYGSINKSLSSLLYSYASKDWVSNAVTTRLLYNNPSAYPINVNIKKLDVKDFTSRPFNLNQGMSNEIRALRDALTSVPPAPSASQKVQSPQSPPNNQP